MQTSESDCIESLRDAAATLGKSPTKAEYEDLGLTPASATIQRVMGGWNEAKEAAGLETNRSTGSRTASKPDDVDIPDGTSWEEMTVDQRWHYKNRDWNAERTLNRRARLRSWVNDRKQERECNRCGENDPAVLDLHHRDGDAKEMAVGEMITWGYGEDELETEMRKCVVLCANCHRREHYDPDKFDPLRQWLHRYKRSTDGCERCEIADPPCLDFHHEDEKGETIARMVAAGRSKADVRDEIEKCVILCANCHRKEHFESPEEQGNVSDDPDSPK